MSVQMLTVLVCIYLQNKGQLQIPRTFGDRLYVSIVSVYGIRLRRMSSGKCIWYKVEAYVLRKCIWYKVEAYVLR